MKLIGDTLLVKKFTMNEIKRKSGIVLAQDFNKHEKLQLMEEPHYVKVVAVGEGYYDETTKESVPLDVKVGQILRVGPTSVYWDNKLPIVDYQPQSVGLVALNAAMMVFDSEEDFYNFYSQIGDTL